MREKKLLSSETTLTAPEYHCFSFFDMARTAATSSAVGARKKKEAEYPLETYNNLQLSKPFTCYQYWLNLFTDGTEGFAVEDKGSRYHRRRFQYLIDNIKENSFRNIGIVSTSLLLEQLGNSDCSHSFRFLLFRKWQHWQDICTTKESD